MIAFVCFAAVLAMASASCPVYKAQDPFSIANFTGTWYKQFSVTSAYEEGSCITSTYTLDELTGELYAYSTRRDPSGQFEEEIGVLAMSDASSTEGKLIFRTKPSWTEVTQGITVLSTDYINYAVLYICYEGDNSYDISESLWVMTHARILTSDIEELIENSLTTILLNGGPSKYLYSSAQENCS